MKESRFRLASQPLFLACLFLGACAGGQKGSLSEVTPMEAPSPPESPSSPAPSAERPGPVKSDSSQPAEKSAEKIAASPPALLEADAFELLLDQAVTSFALGNAPRISVLSQEPWIFDGKKWKVAPIPQHLRNWQSNSAQVRIFYGRDNQPRLMGWTAATEASGGLRGGVYLRHKLSGWQREPAELGRLGNSQGALYGILGEADPEVVCRPGDVCLIKRVSGWGQTPADTEPAWIQMTGDQVLKVTTSGVSLLVLDAWQEVTQDRPAGEVTSVWGQNKKKFYLAAGGRLFRHTQEKWDQVVVPLESCLVAVESTENELWVGGVGGLCRFKDSVWSCNKELFGRVVQLELTAESIFVGGEKGLFRARR